MVAGSAFDTIGKAYGNLYVVDHHEESKFKITQLHLAGIKDISFWLDTLLYALLYKDKYPGYNLYDEVYRFIMLCVDYAERYLVDIYDIMKMRPSLCISSILRDMEDDPGFYNTLRPDIPYKGHPHVVWMT